MNSPVTNRLPPLDHRLPEPSPGLLVSVRSVAEARSAMLGGANVIDLKEPSRGSLGACDAKTWFEVAEAVRDERPLTLALGEATAWSSPEFAEVPSSVAAVKLGSASIEIEAYLDVISAVSRSLMVPCVAVAYADAERAGAPALDAFCHGFSRLPSPWLLVDTWLKDGSGLLDWLSQVQLKELDAECSRFGIHLVLAGQLRSANFSQLAGLAPRLLAVRGAACRGGREGEVDPDCVGELQRKIRDIWLR